jgi:hypothetical protein
LIKRLVRAALAVLVMALGLYAWNATADGASSLPADKMTVTGSNTPIMGPNTDAVLMTAQMKTSTPADLVLQLTAECTILSNITNAGTSTSSYSTIVRIWIEIDGRPVPVVPGPTTTGASSGGAGTDDGRVVFCNRELTRSTTFQSNSESIKDIERTEQANAFNWVALNVGNGIHNIVVKANFENTNTGDAMSHGVVDKRTLVVEPTNYFISQPSA